MATRRWPDGRLRIANYEIGLSDTLHRQQRFEEAESLALSSMEKRRAILDDEHFEVQLEIEYIVQLYEKWGKTEEAAQWRALLTPPE